MNIVQRKPSATVWVDIPMSATVPLYRLEVGQSGVILALHVADERRLRKMMAFGVLPGVTIRLLRRFPAYVFEVGYSQFAVDEEIAAAIEVRPFPASPGRTVCSPQISG